MTLRRVLRIRDDEGVATIVGVVLILAMAIIILVSVFAVLNNLPQAAQAPASVRMQNMQLENYENPLGTAGYLVISFIYESGPILHSSSSAFIVLYQNSSYEYPLASLGLTSISPGTIVNFNSSSMTSPDIIGGRMPLLNENSSVGMELVQFGKVVWSSSKLVQMQIQKPVVANSWVSGYTGQPFVLYASVYTSYNVTVTGNFSLLYNGEPQYDNYSLKPTGNQNTYEASLGAVDNDSYYEIKVWTMLPSGKGGMVSQWFKLNSQTVAVVSAGIVDINVFVRGLPSSIWVSNSLPIRISGVFTSPPSSPPMMPANGYMSLPPWYDTWVHIDQNNTSFSTLGYQVVGVTGVDQYFSVNDSEIVGVSWDGAAFVGESVIDNGIVSNFSSPWNNLILLPSSGVVNIYVNFTSISRVVVIGTENIYNQSSVSFSLGMNGISSTETVSAGSLQESPPSDVYPYHLQAPGEVTIGSLSSNVGQSLYANYSSGGLFKGAKLSPGSNITIVINAVPLLAGNVSFTVYGISQNVEKDFRLTYGGASFSGLQGTPPPTLTLNDVPWGLHSFAIPSVLYSPNGKYKYVLQAENLPGITVNSNGNGTFQVVFLQNSYPLYYVNKTIYYYVNLIISPVNAGSGYYQVNGNDYYSEQSFAAGSIITFYAYNSSKYFGFSYFSGTIPNSYSTSALFTVKLTGNDTELAVFSSLYYFSLSVNGYGQVSVKVNYANGSVVQEEATYQQPLTVFPLQPGSTVTLTETPLFGSSFTSYSGYYASSSSYVTITVNSNASEYANFAGGHPPQSLTVVVNGTGTAYFDGTSTSSTKTVIVEQGTSVTISESPGLNYEFVDFSGYYQSSTNTQITFVVNSNGTEYVNFKPISVSLTVIISPSGGGSATVNGNPDTSTFTLSVSYGSSVTITEQNSSGYTFSSFSGYYSSTQSSVTFPVTSDGTEYVNFAVIYVSVTIDVNPSGDGTVYILYGGSEYSTTSSYTLYNVPWGSSFSLSSSPSTGYYFSSYSGSYGYSQSSGMNFNADGGGTEYASFNPLVQYSVTVVVDPYNSGTAYVNGATSGTVTTQQTFTVYSGSSISISASLSNPNFVFSSFSGTYGYASNTYISFTVTQNGTEYVNFQYIYSSVTIDVSPGGAGTASWTGAASGSTSFLQTFQVRTGSYLTLSESASSKYAFNGYSGSYGSSSSPSFQIEITFNGTEYVNFNYLYSNLTVIVNPPGAGTVYFDGIPITSSYTASVLTGSSVTLVSSNTNTPYYSFTDFSGFYGTSSSTSYTFTVSASGTEYANFQSNAHTFTLIVSPAGADTVQVVAPNLQQYTTDTSETITYYGSNVYFGLSYGYSPDYTFEDWSGYYYGTGSTALFSVSGNVTEYADFVKVKTVMYTLTVVISPSGGGQVSVNGINVPYSGWSNTYDAGTTISMSEAPYTGYTFSGYSGLSTSSTFTLNANGTEYVNFQQQQSQPYSVTITVNPSGVAMVNYQWTNQNGAIQNGATSSSQTIQILTGSSVTVSVSQNSIQSGYEWNGFTGYDSSQSNSVTFSPSYTGGTETANFVYAQQTPTYSVTISSAGPGYVYFYYQGTKYTTGTWGNNAQTLTNVPSGTQITLTAQASSPSGGTVPQFTHFDGTYGNFAQWENPVTITVNQNGNEIGYFTRSYHNTSNFSVTGDMVGAGPVIKGNIEEYQNMTQFALSQMPVDFLGASRSGK